jgi:hypothetical protein
MEKMKLGDIVTCRFPHTENPHQPGPITRPCLVVQILNPPGICQHIVVAFGTDSQNKSNTGFALHIPLNFKASGLKKPTTFVLSRMKILPATTEFFQLDQSGTPRVGAIDTEHLIQMNQLTRNLSHISDALCTVLAGTAGQSEIASVSLLFDEKFTGRTDLNGLLPPPASFDTTFGFDGAEYTMRVVDLPAREIEDKLDNFGLTGADIVMPLKEFMKCVESGHDAVLTHLGVSQVIIDSPEEVEAVRRKNRGFLRRRRP